MAWTKHEKSLITQCSQRMTDKMYDLPTYRFCMYTAFGTVTNFITGEFLLT
jgi:hypothetical protein